MPTDTAWEAFAALGSVIVFLGAVVFGMQRLGLIRPRPSAPSAASADEAPGCDSVRGDLNQRVTDIERDIQALKMHLAENYVSRSDWVPVMARVVGTLEDHTRLLSRLDERTNPRGAT